MDTFEMGQSPSNGAHQPGQIFWWRAEDLFLVVHGDEPPCHELFPSSRDLDALLETLWPLTLEGVEAGHRLAFRWNSVFQNKKGSHQPVPFLAEGDEAVLFRTG